MKNFLLLLVAALVPLSAALLPTAAGAAPAAGPPRAPTTTCAAKPVSAPPGTDVVSVTAAAHAGGTVTPPGQAPIIDVPAWCDITVTVTHPGAGDRVLVKVSLPQEAGRWTGRFQATGGSAYLAGDLDGIFGAPLIQGVKAGYATAATDAGVGGNPLDVSGWALTASGEVNKPLLHNFASRSLHDLAVVGKSVTAAFYGRAVDNSYWNGCSTGGRQGYELAQDYPKDFQGILAKAPAVNWDRFAVATLWSQAVFHEKNVKPSQCELAAFTAAAVKACDRLDGVKNGIIDDPQKCHFDARRLIGTKIVCDGKEITISKAVAQAIRKVWAGPVSRKGEKLWYGPNKGADLAPLASPGAPFFVADSWVRYFVKQDPTFDTTKLTYAQFERIFRQSQKKYNRIIGTDDPDLSAFARAGGKLLSWHGQKDELVPTRGTIDYRKRVNRLSVATTGSTGSTDSSSSPA